MTNTEIRTTKDGLFEWGYANKPSQWSGSPALLPIWWAQHLGDGTLDVFDTKKECLTWIQEWYEIGE